MSEKIKPVPHKHAAVIKAWADGHVVQLKMFSGEWTDLDMAGGDSGRTPLFETQWEYRIKPEPSDFEKYGVEVGDVWSTEGGYTQTVARVKVCGNKYQTISGVTCGEHHLKTLLFRRGEVNKL